MHGRCRTIEAGSLEHLMAEVKMKIGVTEEIQIFVDEAMVTSLDALNDKAKVVIRGLPKPSSPSGNGSGAGLRNLTLLVMRASKM